jgi:hypothetical protein
LSIDKQRETEGAREKERERERGGRERKDSLVPLDALLSGLSKYFIAR